MEVFGKEELNNLVDGANRILITGAANPSIDIVSTAAAWWLFLNKKNKQVDVAFDGHINKYNFLPEGITWQDKLENLNRFKIVLNISRTKVKQLSYDADGDELVISIVSDGGSFNAEDVETEQGDYKYDLVLCLGAVSLETMGSIYNEHRHFFHQIPVINLDRSILNENYGQLNIIRPAAASLAEISYEILSEDADKIMTTNFLAGMISATNSFQSSQVTPATLELASQLIVRGADREKVIESLYRTKDIQTLKNWGRVLSRLGQHNHIVVSYLKHEELDNLPQDFQDLVRDLILTTPEAQVAVIFYQLELEKTEVWVYTMDNIDALELVRDLNPKGHRRFAQVIMDRGLERAKEIVLEKLGAKLKIINSIF